MDKFIKLTFESVDYYINVTDIISIQRIKTSALDSVNIYYQSAKNSKATLVAGPDSNIYEFIIDNVLKANNSSKTEIVFTPVNQPVLTVLNLA